MLKTTTEIKKKIRDMVLPYYKENDLAHQIEHADKVYENILYLYNKYVEEKLNVKLLVLGTYIHDVKAKDRENHHIEAATWIIEHRYTEPFKELTDKEIDILVQMVKEHRSSFKGEYSSIYSELLASADLDKPKLSDIVRRTIDYNLSLYNLTRESLIKTLSSSQLADIYSVTTYIPLIKSNSIEHIKEKYSTKGYIRYPSFYKLEYSEDIERIQKLSDNIEMFFELAYRNYMENLKLNEITIEDFNQLLFINDISDIESNTILIPYRIPKELVIDYGNNQIELITYPEEVHVKKKKDKLQLSFITSGRRVKGTVNYYRLLELYNSGKAIIYIKD